MPRTIAKPFPSRRAAIAAALVAAGSLGRARADEPAAPPPSGHGLPSPAPAAAPGPSLTPRERWARRHPQPVLVADLIGRTILDRDQGVLGTVRTLVTARDGSILIAFDRRAWLLFRGETVVVPNDTTALLGQFVMILDQTDEDLARLPLFDPRGTTPVEPTTKIRMALTKH